MLRWINRVDLFWLFVFLLAFHGLLYYSLGTDNWMAVTLMATAVDTGIVASLRFLLMERGKQKGK